VSAYTAEIDPVRRAGRILRWGARWVAVPVLAGVLVSGNIDLRSLPLVGTERETAVLLLDGQAYFGHLDDSGETGTLLLRDVYYFQDAKSGPTGLPVGLVLRGQEAHEPADGMRINRDKVLAIERVRPESAVGQAIAAERALRGTSGPFVSLNRPAIATRDALAPQRSATEQGIQRGFLIAAAQLAKLNELVLPITKSEAQAIMDKASGDLRTVRQSALGAIAQAMRMSASDAEAYVRTTDAQLDRSAFTADAGVLLAPDLNVIVTRASQLYAQVGDAAAKQLTQPKAAPSTSPSQSPSTSPSPSPTASSRPSATPTARP
jgi:hypothetical protein